MRQSPHKASLAAEVWRNLFDFLISSGARRGKALARHGLTPNDSRALFTLNSTGKTMRELAQEWACDPSNATFIVDRLEARKLAARGAQTGDRRVKLVTLTPLGIKTRRALARDFYKPPAELMELGVGDLEVLLTVASKLRPAGTKGTLPPGE